MVKTKENINVSDFMLARKSSVPGQVMLNFIFRDTEQVFNQWYDLTIAIDDMKDDISNIIYKAVPKVADKKDVLRAAINLRRDIFNNREVNIKESEKNILMNVMPEKDKESFIDWFSLYYKIQTKDEAIEEAYERELEIINLRFYDYFKSEQAEEILKGIMIASEDFFASLNMNSEELKNVNSNLSRTAFSYLQRSALKTSPFSSLTQLAPVQIEKRGDVNFVFEKKKNNVKYNRAIISTILESIALENSELFKFELNSIVNINKSKYITKQSYFINDGFFWRDEDVIRNENLIKTIGNLPEHFHEEGFYLHELEKHLHPLRATFLIKTLQSEKLLRPILPVTINDPFSFNSMAHYLKQNSDGRNTEIIKLLNKLDEYKINFEDYTLSTKHRGTIKKDMEKTIISIFGQLNVQQPSWLKNSTVFYEDVQSDFGEINLPFHLKNELEELHSMISHEIEVSPLYTLIVDYFLEEYGINTSCNLLDFIFTLGTSMNYQNMITKAHRKDKSALELTSKGKSMPLPNATIFFQLVAKSIEDVENGNYELVANKIHSSSGSIFSRFNELLSFEKYGSYLSEWIKGNYKSSQPAEYSPGSDWSNLQEYFGMLNEVITGFADLNYNVDELVSIDIKELIIEYSTETHTLDIKNKDGKYISPVYLGTTPHHLFRGPIGVLLSMINPWVINTDYGINAKPWEKPHIYSSVTFIPREQQGKLVLNRGKWIVPKEHLPIKKRNESDVNFYKRLHIFIKTHNIPNEVYMTIDQNDTNIMSSQKPVWLHFNSPHCLKILSKNVNENVQQIIFTESLPSSVENWLSDENGLVYTTEFMSIGRMNIYED